MDNSSKQSSTKMPQTCGHERALPEEPAPESNRSKQSNAQQSANRKMPPISGQKRALPEDSDPHAASKSKRGKHLSDAQKMNRKGVHELNRKATGEAMKKFPRDDGKLRTRDAFQQVWDQTHPLVQEILGVVLTITWTLVRGRNWRTTVFVSPTTRISQPKLPRRNQWQRPKSWK